MDDLQNFSFVEEVLDPVSDFDPLSMISNETKHLVAMRTHSFSDQCEAVRNGVGLGFLPTFATACDDNIVPLLDEIHGRQDIFLTYRRSSGAHRNLRAVINWLKAIFDRRIYPWFPKSLFQLVDLKIFYVVCDRSGVVEITLENKKRRDTVRCSRPVWNKFCQTYLGARTIII